MTRASKSLLVSFMTFGVICIAGGVTLHSTRFHNFLLSLLGRGTGWKITALKSEIHILRGIVVLKNFDAQDSKGRIHITGDRVLLNLSSLSLIRGKIIATDLEVDHPTIDISKIPPPAGPTPDFLTVLLPDIMNTLFTHFDRSIILQNLILEHVSLHDFVLLRYGGKTATFQGVTLSIATNFLREIEIKARLENASGLLPSLQSADLDLLLSKAGLKLKKADLDLKKVQLSVAGEWKGTLEKGSLKVDGTVQASTVLSDPLKFGIEAAVGKGIAAIKKVDAQLGPATFEGKGSFHIEKRSYELAFTAKNLALESIFSKLPSPVLGPAKGMASVEGKASGQLPKLEAKARATIMDFRHGAMAAKRTEGTLDFHWPELDWDAEIKAGADGRTQGQVKGGVAFKVLQGPEYEGKRKAVLKTLDLSLGGASLQDILPTLNVSGRLDGELHLKGVAETTSVAGPGHAKVTDGHWFLGAVPSLTADVAFRPHGKITFTKTEIQLPNVSPMLWPDPLELDTSGESVLFSGKPMAGFSVKGRYEKDSGYFRIDAFDIQRSGANLKGSLGLRRGGAVEGKTAGNLNLEWLAVFPSLFRNAEGVARVDLALSGTTKQPSFRGKIDFNQNEIELRGFPGITGLAGTLSIDGPGVSSKLTGFLGDGKFDLSGRLHLNGYRPDEFDLALQGSNLTFSRPKTYHIDFDANVTLKGSPAAPRLDGRIDIVDGRYTKPFVIRELVLKPFEEDTAAEPDFWQKTLDPLALHVTVKNSGDLKIQNNIATILLFSDLLVEGTYGRPKITGAMTATEGTLRILGEDFLLNEGRLEYIDPAKREPYLTLIAQQEISTQYTVYVEVKGFLSNLDINLSSTPSLPREEILSLLTTGVTQEELRQSGRSRRSIGSEILAEEISGVMERPISRRTGLDVFRLEASESGSLSKLAVGKNITDRLTLELQSDFAPETAQRSLQANYYLTDNILLKGARTWQSTSVPNYNLNISFRFRLF